MKKFLLRIGLFFAAFIVVILIPVYSISEYDNADKGTSENHNIISLQTKSHYDSLDVLFVGNSYCYSSINTQLLDSLNIRSFNLGIATAGVEFYDLIIEDYYAKTKVPPKKVLLLVTPMTFSSQSDNFSAYPIHRYLENEKSNFQISLKAKSFTMLISLYKKSFEKGVANLFFKEKKQPKAQRFNRKGFLPDSEVVTPEVIAKDEPLYLGLKNDRFDESKIEDLVEIANRLTQKGSEVLFFELPTHLLPRYFSTEYLAAYNKGLASIREKFELIALDPALFHANNYRNIDHMNTSGATIATAHIVRVLYEK